jgi:hypothetical protein
LQQTQAEAIAARFLDMLDVAARRERRENARDAARVDSRPSRELVRAELASFVRKRLEHPDCPLDRRDVTDGWPSGTRHATFSMTDMKRYCRGGN